MATILVEILGSSKQFKSELAGAEAATGRATGAFSKMGAVVGTAGVAIAAGLAYGVAKSVEAATQFQSSMELIQTQAGGSAKEVKNMSKSLLDMASKVGSTPDELSKGLYHVESAGFRGAKALSILKLAAEGAAVGHSDLETTTTALVAAQRSGIKGLGDMSHAMGSLNAIVGAGNMRMDDLTSALGTGILPSAKAFGLSIADVGGALATMTSNGIPAVNAASGLKMMFASLAAPTHKAKDALKSVGLSSTDLAETMRSKGLNAALVELKGHMSGAGLNAVQTAALLTDAFGKKSSTGLLTLLGNLKDMKTATDQVKTGASGFGAAWEETQKSSEFATKKFHASIAALEIQVGASLLPTVTRFTNWMTAELPAAIEDAKRAIAFLTPYFLQVKAAVEEVVTAVRTHWTQISQILREVVDVIRTTLNLFGDLIHGRWSQIWADLVAIGKSAVALIVTVVKDIGPTILAALEEVGRKAVQGLERGLQALPGALKAGLAALPGLALTAATLIGEAIVKGVKWAVPHIIGLAGDLTGAIGAAINQVAGWALGAAESIGISIADGIKAGIASAWGGVKSFFSTSILDLIGSGKTAAKAHSPSTRTRDEIGIPLAQGVAEGWLVGSASLPATIAQSLQNAITAGRAVIQAAQATFQTAWSQLASSADAAFSGISGAAKTPAEKQLADEQAGRDTGARTAALRKAQNDLLVAKGTGDYAAITAAEQAISDAELAIHIAGLEKIAAVQRRELDARNALQQTHFDAALVTLQTHLAKGHSTYEEAHKAILKLFKSFGINYSNAGANLGAAFITGLKESIQSAAKQSGSLAGTLEHVAAGIHVPQAATGGFVAQTGLAVIHQGETITPAGGGGGITVNVTGWVGNDQDIAEKIRNVLIRTGRNTTRGALGGFA